MRSQFRYFAVSMNVTILTLPLAVSMCLPLALLAQTSSSVVQTLVVEVKPITRIAVSGNPSSLFITDVIGNADVLTASDDNTKYSMVTNLENMKIVASINDPMPAGTKLMMKLASTRGLSDGLVDVSNAMSPVELVSALGKGSDLNQTITYTFAADVSVGQLAVDSRTITLTLTN